MATDWIEVIESFDSNTELKTLVFLDATDQVLATCKLAENTFSDLVNGSYTANNIGSDSSTIAGTAAKAQIRDHTGASIFGDFTVSTAGGGGNVEVSSLTFLDGQKISVLSLTLVLESVVISSDFDRSSIDLSASSVTPNGTTPTVFLQPIKEVNTHTGATPTYWYFYCKIRNANGMRPLFQVPQSGDFDGPFSSSWRPKFSYDGVTWTDFSSDAVVLTNYEFQHTTEFTQNEVYISYAETFTVKDSLSLIQSVMETAYGFRTPSAIDDTGTISIVSEQIDSIGRTIPRQIFRSVGITDSTLFPIDGSPKRNAVLIAGVHGSEDHGNHTLKGSVDFLLSEDPVAIELRRNFKFFIYPMVNPVGRYGGAYRGTWQNNLDPNREWGTGGLECINIAIAAITRDTGENISFFWDYHTAPNTVDRHFFRESASDADFNAFYTAFSAYDPNRVIANIATAGVAFIWAKQFGGLSGLSEIGVEANQSLSTVYTFGENIMRALNDVFNNGLFNADITATGSKTLSA